MISRRQGRVNGMGKSKGHRWPDRPPVPGKGSRRPRYVKVAVIVPGALIVATVAVEDVEPSVAVPVV
jgi:hypothetical protein